MNSERRRITRRRAIGCIFAALLVFCLAAAGVFADSESDGAAAEKAGRYREALNYYVAALQGVPEGSAKEQELREKAIALAEKLKPAPAVPEDAMRHLGRGRAAVELAKTAEDFRRAATEFQKALRAAPWFADAYYNLGLVQEKAGRLEEAMAGFKLYLLAAPNAADAEQLRTRLYGLEYKLEQARKEKQEHENRQLADQRLAASLVGIWTSPPSVGSRNERGQTCPPLKVGYRIQASANGTQLRIVAIGYGAVDYRDTCKSWYSRLGDQVMFDGRVREGKLEGTYNQIMYGSDGASVYKSRQISQKLIVAQDIWSSNFFESQVKSFSFSDGESQVKFVRE